MLVVVHLGLEAGEVEAIRKVFLIYFAEVFIPS